MLEVIMHILTLISLAGWSRIIERLGKETSKSIWSELVSNVADTAQLELKQADYIRGELWVNSYHIESSKKAESVISRLVSGLLYKLLDTSFVQLIEIKVSAALMRSKEQDISKIRHQASCALTEIFPECNQGLLRVFAHKNLVSYWQSIRSIQQDGIYGYEALIRGPKDSELHRADKLFGAAMALNRQFDMEILALKTHLNAHQYLCDTSEEFRLTINLSPSLLGNIEVEKLLIGYKRADLLSIELTEHLPIENWQPIEKQITKYREMGYTLWLDDVGCGFFELDLINAVKPDVAKLCITIINRLSNNASIINDIKQVVETVHRYGGKVLAEGVETAEQLEISKRIGIDFAQGYYFDKPREMGT